MAALPALAEELRPYIGPRLLRALTTVLAVGIPIALISVVNLFPRSAFAATYRGRTFLVPSLAVATTARLAVARADQIAPPGGRLFVGPSDLRRTFSNDTYM